MRLFAFAVTLLMVALAAAPVHGAPAQKAQAESASQYVACTVDDDQPSCPFLCLPSTYIHVVFVGFGGIRATCGGKTVSCSTSGGACTADSDRVSTLSVGKCEMYPKFPLTQGTGVCYIGSDITSSVS